MRCGIVRHCYGREEQTPICAAFLTSAASPFFKALIYVLATEVP